MVVVSIDMREKSEIWSTRETRNPAPVFAIDSTRDMDLVCLLIDFRMKDGCAVMPAAIDAFAACAVELLWDDAVVRVVQGLEAGVSSNEHKNLFLAARPRHCGAERWHPERIAPVFLLCYHAPEAGPQEGVIVAASAVTVEAELPRLMRLALPA